MTGWINQLGYPSTLLSIRDGLHKGAVLQPSDLGQAFKGLGIAERVLQERFDWR